MEIFLTESLIPIRSLTETKGANVNIFLTSELESHAELDGRDPGEQHGAGPSEGAEGDERRSELHRLQHRGGHSQQPPDSKS